MTRNAKQLKHARGRIALLTPYDGGNIGDGAIQEALIFNLRKYAPNVDLCGITLDPARTATQHHISCYPLAAIPRPHYQPVRTSHTAAAVKSYNPPAGTDIWKFLAGARRAAGRLPLLKQLKLLARETAHILRSYRLLREIDLLLIAGGGQLDEEWGGSWGHPYALMKWSLLAKAAGSQVVFLSVGACRVRSRLTRSFLKLALSSAYYRSYRDEESRRIAISVTAAADGPVVPDLAFSLPPVSKERTTRSEGPLRIGVNPIAYGHRTLWPTANPAQYERYLGELGSFIQAMVRSGASISLFSSSAPDDQIFEDLRKHLGSSVDSKSGGSLSVGSVENVGDLLGVLRSVDFVVGSRLHGILLSFLCGKPAIAISYDRKVTCLMEELGQGAYCVDIASFKSQELLDRLATLRVNREAVQSNIAAVCSQYDHLLREQYRLIAQLLKGDNSLREMQPAHSNHESDPRIGRFDAGQITDSAATPMRGAGSVNN